MKKQVFLLILLLVFPLLAAAQSEYVLQVIADSAFLRAAPALDAAAAASVFENDSLIAIGRNVDGEWLQVSRPGNRSQTGWVTRRLVAFTFEVAQLPLTDLTTGVTGPEPVVNTGVSVLLLGEATLRTAPGRNAPRADVVPANLTLPVIERTPDNQWLKINFRGTTGWIAEFVTRTSANLNDAPISPEYAGSSQFAALEHIPPELQLAQVDRLLTYVKPAHETAAGVATYWKMLAQGETMACTPSERVSHFVNSARDLVELPELRRQERVLQQAVDDLNSAIDAMHRCGIYLPNEIAVAYAGALNAQAIFNTVIIRMENLREHIADRVR